MFQVSNVTWNIHALKYYLLLIWHSDLNCFFFFRNPLLYKVIIFWSSVILELKDSMLEKPVHLLQRPEGQYQTGPTRADRKWEQAIFIRLVFLNCSQESPEILLKCRFWYLGLEWGRRLCLTNKDRWWQYTLNRRGWGQWFSKFSALVESPGGLIKHSFLGPALGVWV